MTYKYLYVRRAIYESKPNRSLNSYRTIKDVKRLFKPLTWIMLGAVLISLALIVLIILRNPISPLVFIPLIIVFLVSILSEILSESVLYNPSARSDELLQKSQDYKQYISEIFKVFVSFDLNSLEKVMVLKLECEEALLCYKNKYQKASNKITDVLIWVPLGALITTIVGSGYKTISLPVVAIILIGLSAFACIKFLRIIEYFSEAYFKDQYLLSIINEFEYSKKEFELFLKSNC